MEKSGKPFRLVNSDTPPLPLAAIIDNTYWGYITCKLHGCPELLKDPDLKWSNNTHKKLPTYIIDYFFFLQFTCFMQINPSRVVLCSSLFNSECCPGILLREAMSTIMIAVLRLVFKSGLWFKLYLYFYLGTGSLANSAKQQKNVCGNNHFFSIKNCPWWGKEEIASKVLSWILKLLSELCW